jgi:hypothetical protein
MSMLPHAAPSIAPRRSLMAMQATTCGRGTSIRSEVAAPRVSAADRTPASSPAGGVRKLPSCASSRPVRSTMNTASAIRDWMNGRLRASRGIGVAPLMADRACETTSCSTASSCVSSRSTCAVIEWTMAACEASRCACCRRYATTPMAPSRIDVRATPVAIRDDDALLERADDAHTRPRRSERTMRNSTVSSVSTSLMTTRRFWMRLVASRPDCSVGRSNDLDHHRVVGGRGRSPRGHRDCPQPACLAAARRCRRASGR